VEAGEPQVETIEEHFIVGRWSRGDFQSTLEALMPNLPARVDFREGKRGLLSSRFEVTITGSHGDVERARIALKNLQGTAF
jgi:hypothetical protein